MVELIRRGRIPCGKRKFKVSDCNFLKLYTLNMVYNVVRAKYVDLNGRGGKYRGEAQPNLR